jgi:hypothetical protein
LNNTGRERREEKGGESLLCRVFLVMKRKKKLKEKTIYGKIMFSLGKLSGRETRVKKPAYEEAPTLVKNRHIDFSL